MEPSVEILELVDELLVDDSGRPVFVILPKCPTCGFQPESMRAWVAGAGGHDCE